MTLRISVKSLSGTSHFYNWLFPRDAIFQFHTETSRQYSRIFESYISSSFQHEKEKFPRNWTVAIRSVYRYYSQNCFTAFLALIVEILHKRRQYNKGSIPPKYDNNLKRLFLSGLLNSLFVRAIFWTRLQEQSRIYNCRCNLFH